MSLPAPAESILARLRALERLDEQAARGINATARREAIQRIQDEYGVPIHDVRGHLAALRWALDEVTDPVVIRTDGGSSVPAGDHEVTVQLGGIFVRIGAEQVLHTFSEAVGRPLWNPAELITACQWALRAIGENDRAEQIGAYA